jgi:6-phosphofructokinase 1
MSFEKELNTQVRTLGNNMYPSPLKLSKVQNDGIFNYVGENDRILYDASLNGFRESVNNNTEPVSFEKAGPREKLFFNSSEVKAGIVTCGGLCPGLNNVIRSLVMELWYRYQVRDIFGFRYGYEGLIPASGHIPVKLTPDEVSDIHLTGGSILGSSRGNQDVPEMVNTLKEMGIRILFCIGGDGTLKGAKAISDEADRQGYPLSVAGIPKTIDNDINFIERSFGFETAFSIASDIVRDARSEATGAYNGIALIKLMGRDSGFIAVHAALANKGVNFVLIPELNFSLEGENGFLNVLKKRLELKHYAVIIVAEGAGQNLFEDTATEKDRSGNVKKKDIGVYLKNQISAHFGTLNIPVTVRYIDPSYIIRSAMANANDSKFCAQLAQNAVHGAMAGKTDFVVGLWNSHFVYLPIELTVKERKKVDLEGELWWNILETTGQPNLNTI